MGTLYVVATPIGNLEDLTERAARVLSEVEVVVAEDTRRTRKLLSHLGVRPKLIAYHADSPESREDAIVERLRAGDIALVSDAGTPGLADPGPDLVGRARREGLAVVPVPGASALATALSVVSFAQQPVTFIGFLPDRAARRERLVRRAAAVARTLVIYLPPHRAGTRVAELLEWLGDRPSGMCRELTKIHEDVRELSLGELAAELGHNTPRGEITLVIDVAGRDLELEHDKEDIEAAVADALAKGMSVAQAAATVAHDLRVSRREAYALAQKLRQEDQSPGTVA